MYVTACRMKKASQKKGFNFNALKAYLAEREGFEPSMGFLNPYSLSRGAPSATRPPLRNSIEPGAVCGRIRSCTGERKDTVFMLSGKA
jgi:hypothetical protein